MCQFCLALPIQLFDCSEPGNNTLVSFERITHPSFLDWVISVGWTPCSDFIDLADQGTVSTSTCDWHVTPCGWVEAYSREFSRITGGIKELFLMGPLACRILSSSLDVMAGILTQQLKSLPRMPLRQRKAETWDRSLRENNPLWEPLAPSKA